MTTQTQTHAAYETYHGGLGHGWHVRFWMPGEGWKRAAGPYTSKRGAQKRAAELNLCAAGCACPSCREARS